MRYTCERCKGFIKDKFLIGLVHFCLTEEEELERKQYLEQQQYAIEKQLRFNKEV